MDVGFQKSHQAGSGWCLNGAFITQIDLDRENTADPHDSPIIGLARCSSMMPASFTIMRRMEYNTDRAGSDYKSFGLVQADPALCQASCNKQPKCKAWTYVKPGIQGPKARCWLKNSVPSAKANSCCVSGVK
jgi:hypothetical protein